MQKTIGALFAGALLVGVVVPANAAGVTTETRDVVGQGPGWPVVAEDGRP